MGRVQDKVTLVTGGASGIGEASCRMLVKEGGKVVITDIDAAAGVALAEELGAAAVFCQHDVRDEQQWRDTIAFALSSFGQLDVLVNNAGISSGDPIEEQSLESWRAVMAVNNDGVFLGCKEAILAMKARGGSIINISSIHGIRAASYATAYTASKGAVRLLTKSVALYCAENGYRIRCNSVHPGYIETPLLKSGFEEMGNAEEMYQMVLEKHPIGRLGKPDDVAYGVLYLASDESDFVTGSEMVMDGGFQL